MVDIVYSPRRDGRDDETNDYTPAEDQGQFLTDVLQSMANICPNMFVVICLTFPAITSWAENNIKQLDPLQFIFVNFYLRERILLISNFRGIDEPR